MSYNNSGYELSAAEIANVHAQADAIFAGLQEREEKESPLQSLIREAREIVAAYDHKALLAARLDQLNSQNSAAHFNALIGKLADITENQITEIGTDLDARLVKQAQSLDVTHDLLLHLSQYALAQDTKSLQSHLNLALRAQDQSARTIEKFQRARKKHLKNAERKEETGNEKKEFSHVD